MREFERAIDAVRTPRSPISCSGQLRKVVRGRRGGRAPRTDDPARLLFRPLEPFWSRAISRTRPGQIRRASLLPIWQWLTRDGAPGCMRSIRS